MTIKITKQLATMEDLAIGTGTVVQERNGVPLTLTKIDLNSRISRVTSIANLRLLTPTDEGTQVLLVDKTSLSLEIGLSGFFKSTLLDISAKVTSDPLSGVYVATALDPTGASGGWIRDISKGIYLSYFGGFPGDEVSAKLQAAINFIVSVVHSETYGKFTTDNVINVNGGEYNLAAQVDTKPYIKIKSKGFVLWNSQHANKTFSCTLNDDDPVENTNKIKQSWARGAWIDGSEGGMRIWREGMAKTGTGLYINSDFTTPNRNQVGRWTVSDVSIGGFFDGILLGTINNFLGLFDNVHIEQNVNQIATEAAGVNQDFGENFRFVNAVIANGNTCILHRKAGCDINFIGCSIDFIDDVIKYANSSIGYSTNVFTSCYFEGIGNSILNNDAQVVQVAVSIYNCWGLFRGTSTLRMFRGTGDVSLSGLEIRALPLTGNKKSADELILCDTTINLIEKRVNFSRDIAPPLSLASNEILPSVAYFTASAVGASHEPNTLVGWDTNYSLNTNTTVIDSDSFSGGKCLQINPLSDNSNLTLHTNYVISCLAGGRYCGAMALKSTGTTQSVTIAFGMYFLDSDGNILQYARVTPNLTISVSDGWALLPISADAFQTAPSGTAGFFVHTSISANEEILFGGIIINKVQ